MQDDLISVIVPASNVEDYLDRCVESLVDQTYENLEIILVDNASSDDTPILCDSWTQRDIRVKVIHNATNNIASCKNAGLDYANGDYITFVDANHFVDKEYIFTLLKNLQETHSDISICSLYRFVENNKQIGVQEQEEVITSNKIVLNLENNDKDIIEEEIEDTEENDNDDVDSVDDDSNEVADDVDSEEDNEESDEEEPESEEVEEYDESDDTPIEDDKFSIEKQNVKVIEKKKGRSRLVIFEGDDIFDYFFSGVDKIKTATYGKLYKKSIFKKLRFDEDRIYEDEFIAHKIYSVCKKFVRTSSGLYYYNVSKKPLKTAENFTLKDLDFYYALENRYSYFKNTKWQPQALNQILTQIANIYCLARAGKGESNTLKFLKHKFKLYYNEQKRHKSYKCFRFMPTLYYNLKCLTTKNK